MELPNDGADAGNRQIQREQDLAEPQHQATSHKNVQAVRDPRFLEKLTDVVGLYLNPPDQAIVLCVDEEEPNSGPATYPARTALKKGRCGTMTHDYKRHGTTTLFAALDVLAGKVISDYYLANHRHQEFLQFLRRINREFPGKLPLHLVMDNYGTALHPRGEGLAQPKSPVQGALHSNQFQLVEPD